MNKCLQGLRRNERWDGFARKRQGHLFLQDKRADPLGNIKGRCLWEGGERSWECSYLAASLFSVRSGAMLARKEDWKKVGRDVRTEMTA